MFYFSKIETLRNGQFIKYIIQYTACIVFAPFDSTAIHWKQLGLKLYRTIDIAMNWGEREIEQAYEIPNVGFSESILSTTIMLHELEWIVPILRDIYDKVIWVYLCYLCMINLFSDSIINGWKPMGL